MIEKCYVIPVQKKCNCNCLFCISKSRDYDKEQEELTCDDHLINNILLLKKRGIKRFEITGGGEPFLNEQLGQIVKTMKTIIPDSYIKLYTNGNILRQIEGIDELDISVVHYDTSINNQFMVSHTPINLQTKLAFFRKMHPTINIRLSIPLIKGAIDKKQELDTMIEQTQPFVDEYVVRTLYPHTPDLANYYVDFEYENPLVVMERNNTVSQFDGILLWSDGNFYTDWSLQQRRWLYSYLLLKPDSRTYINEIEQLIIEEGFEIVKKVLFKNFCENALKLYEDKDPEYLKIIKRHIEICSFLFGNEALVFLLDKETSLENLLEDTLSLKRTIRKEWSLTHSLNGVVTIGLNESHLNLVHCPDNEPQLFDHDLSVIDSLGCTRVLDESSYSLIKKYRSYEI